MSKTQRRVFLAWGLVIAALVLLTIPFPPESRPEQVTAMHWLLWVGFYAAFLIAFGFASRLPAGTAQSLLLLCETGAVIGIVSTRPALGLEGALFASVAFQLGAQRRTRVAVAWITAQSLVAFAILGVRFGLDHASTVIAVYFPFQVLAWFTSGVLARETLARETLARVNGELLATRGLLAENTRSAERLRISRELHDVFGHRLAALSVNLEAAERVQEDERMRFVAHARAAAKGLLADVREVVTNMRRTEPIDVTRALRVMVHDVTRPAIHVDCPHALAVADREVAHAVLRCAQELVTNAIKHAKGEHLRLELRSLDAGIELIAADDGDGADELREGNGLRGMRERLDALGGSIDVDTATHEGFRVRVFIPGASA
jgi:signal transduction histidine kinase